MKSQGSTECYNRSLIHKHIQIKDFPERTKAIPYEHLAYSQVLVRSQVQKSQNARSQVFFGVEMPLFILGEKGSPSAVEDIY